MGAVTTKVQAGISKTAATQGTEASAKVSTGELASLIREHKNDPASLDELADAVEAAGNDGSLHAAITANSGD